MERVRSDRRLTQDEAEQLGAEWAEWNSDGKRTRVVRAMRGAGLSKNSIHKITGIARTTIDRIIQGGILTFTAQVHPSDAAWLAANRTGVTREGDTKINLTGAAVERLAALSDSEDGVMDVERDDAGNITGGTLYIDGSAYKVERD